jgi:hypothetical protein
MTRADQVQIENRSFQPVMGRRALKRVLACAAALVAVTATTATPANAEPNPGQDQGQVQYRDYADPAGYGTAGQEQCAVPVAERQGAWACLKDVGQGVKRSTQADGTCSLLGCYYYEDSYVGFFDGTMVYGYRDVLLGEVLLYGEDSFSGGQSTTRRFQFESTRGVQTITAEGERLYFSSAHPEGYPVSGGATYRVWGPTGPYQADQLVTAFGTSGYQAYESSVAWAGIVHQFTWTDPSSAYPGRWFAWWKSAKFQRQSSGQYTLNNPPQMGAEPYGSGWRAS